jgi:hypothetical protein
MCGLVRSGYAGEVQAEFFAHLQVHLVVHQPQGHLGDLRRELFNLDAVKLVHVHANQAGARPRLLARWPCELGAQHGQLQQAQFAVG